MATIRKTYIDYQKIKQLIPISAALRRLGISRVRGYGYTSRGRCAIHGSRRLNSDSLAWTENEWWCHRCKIGGDVIRLWALVHNLTPYDAALDLCRRFDLRVPEREP